MISLIKTVGTDVWGNKSQSTVALSNIMVLPDMIVFNLKRSEPANTVFAVGDRILIGNDERIIKKVVDYSPRHLEILF
ncbi:MAG: hypothetical protein RSA97_02275 [Oscillospiraceae bacterium]